MSQSTESYRYTPLDHPASDLRLIRIEEGRPENVEIKCTIEKYSTASAPAYQALSYAWGADTEKQPITVNEKVFLVTGNLHYALQSLQVASGGRHFWIDAICIDQHNIEERNEQVQAVYIYLGNHSEDSDAIIDRRQERWGVQHLAQGSAYLTRRALELATALRRRPDGEERDIHNDNYAKTVSSDLALGHIWQGSFIGPGLTVSGSFKN